MKINKLILSGFVLLLSLAAHAGLELSEDVGYYIGSFDMPTKGHVTVAVESMERFKLKKLYITVNYNTDKDFNTSVDERVDMLKLLFADYGDRVVILREPLEGRPYFANYLNKKHPRKIIGIFGDDTYDKNFKIFNGIENFDFIKVERPEPQLESVTAEAAYVPIIHEMSVVADGLSSSLGRKLIAEGKDASHVVSPAVMKYIHDKGLYQPPKPEELAEQEARFKADFQDFYEKLLKHAPPGTDFSGVGTPKFKPGQSKQAQQDKFIRWIADQKGLKGLAQLPLRQLAEEILGYESRSSALRSEKKAGLYFGSFDPPTNGQKEVMLESIRQLGLDVLYVAALEHSPKDLNASLSERTEMLKRLAAESGAKLVVLNGAPSGAKLAKFVEQVANEHTTPLTAIFGENVFQKNHDQLRHLESVKFAMVPRSDAAPKVPDGVELVRTKSFDIPSSSGTDVPPLDALPDSVRDYVEDGKLYEKRSESEFQARFDAFLSDLKGRLPKADFSQVARPAFKATQTLEGQNDKFLHWASTSKAPGATAAELRREALFVLGRLEIRFPMVCYDALTRENFPR